MDELIKIRGEGGGIESDCDIFYICRDHCLFIE